MSISSFTPSDRNDIRTVVHGCLSDPDNPMEDTIKILEKVKKWMPAYLERYTLDEIKVEIEAGIQREKKAQKEANSFMGFQVKQEEDMGINVKLPPEVKRKNDFLKRFNQIPYDEEKDIHNLNVELSNLALINPEFYNIFDKGPETWNFEDIQDIIFLMAQCFLKSEIKLTLDTYGGKAWRVLDEAYMLDMINQALENEEIVSESKAINEYGIPIEFDGLYKLSLSEEGQIRKIILLYENIADKISRDLHTIAFKDQVFVYDNGIYLEGEGRVKAEIARIVKGVKAVKPEVQISVTGADKEIMYYILHDSFYPEWPFDAHKNMLPVKNGILHLDFDREKVDLIPFDPEYRFTLKLPVIYDSHLDSKPINDILKSYVDMEEREEESDKGELIKTGYSDVDLLYQIPAQAILQQTGASTFKKAYLLQGDANAGKSTFLKLLGMLFGNENISEVSLQTSVTDRFALANLEGKILNCYDDLSEIPLNEAGKFKSLTGAYKQRIEKKGKQAYEAEIKAVHVYTCNTAPDFNEKIKRDTAFWERWEFINFFNLFEVDPFFVKKTFTQKNLSGFLNAILLKVFEIKKHGRLLVGSTAGEVQEKWQYNADPLYRFIEDQFNQEIKKLIFLDKNDFWEIYKQYSNDKKVNSAKIPKTLTAFTQLLHKYDITENKKVIDGVRKSVYCLPYSWKEKNGRYYIEPLLMDKVQVHL